MATAICCAVQRGSGALPPSRTLSRASNTEPAFDADTDAFDGERDGVPGERNASTVAATTIAVKAPTTTQVSRVRILL
jgi:hypothetical protein